MPKRKRRHDDRRHDRRHMIKITIDLVVAGDGSAAHAAVEAALDSGELQDFINRYEIGGERVHVTQAVQR